MTEDGIDERNDGKSLAMFYVCFRGSAFMTSSIRYRVNAMQNALHVTKTECYNRIFEAGLAQLEKENSEQVDPMAKAFAEKKRELEEHKQLMDQLTEFYASMSPEEFLLFCEEAKVPESTVDKFMENYTWRNEDQRWASRANDFLRDALFGKDPLPTKQIREMAVVQGVIEDNATDWQRLRTLASRHGFTNCPQYGHWQYKSI